MRDVIYLNHIAKYSFATEKDCEFPQSFFTSARSGFRHKFPHTCARFFSLHTSLFNICRILSRVHGQAPDVIHFAHTKSRAY